VETKGKVGEKTRRGEKKKIKKFTDSQRIGKIPSEKNKDPPIGIQKRGVRIKEARKGHEEGQSRGLKRENNRSNTFEAFQGNRRGRK